MREGERVPLKRGKCCHCGGERPCACPPPSAAILKESTERPLAPPQPSPEDGASPCPARAPGCPWLNFDGRLKAVGSSIEPMHSCHNYFLNARCVRRASSAGDRLTGSYSDSAFLARKSR